MEKADKNLIQVVKNKLWKFGYSVRDVSDIDVPYDILVDNKHRVKIGSEKPSVLPSKVDVYALVKKSEVVYFVKPKAGLAEHTSPYAVFGKK